MTPVQLDHIAEQLKAVLSAMASDKLKGLAGGISQFHVPRLCHTKHAYATVGVFNDHIWWMSEPFYAEAFIEILMCHLPRNAAVRFTHGDLLSKNIMIPVEEKSGPVSESGICSIES
ncbi:hypothetical protein CVT25_004478 [Psilocybe cyanescens]|uniref:Aminoglycoside phosphotransferase domain-containing protein n=1 Tax=Psilocybe cyanescens TaxID=93625 RepID=A0A409X2I7_PSICY|nr:hypothetical protein CVT25_004478 [Psilocybe cyanescens]